MLNLVDELQKAYDGDAWHGSNVLSLLLNVNATKVFMHPIPNAHSIAELVLHLTAWTEEVIDRIKDQQAKEPTRGDWPQPKEETQKEWGTILEEFKNANQTLIDLTLNFSAYQWLNHIKDERNSALGTGVNNAQLLNGLIQHHAYHSGQIALLLKF